jgi:LAO/AO transport system kinase
VSGTGADWTNEALVAGVLDGDARALARAISLVEDGDPLGDEVVRSVYEQTGRALVVGVTGAPGSGKSSLVAALVGVARADGATVGVVSVDPSSIQTRGALLGDRIRLVDHFLDPDVFIRSMGSRGHAGGLAAATHQAMHLLDAAGKDLVVVETVGAGQADLDVAGVADVVVLTLMPGAGDAIQALKAGIMEIPDVIAVTKSDLPGAGATLADVRSAVALEPDPERRPAIVATSATTGDGVDELWSAIGRVRATHGARGSNEERRRLVATREVVGLATARLRRRLEGAIREDGELRELVQAVERRELDPSSAATRLLELTSGETGGNGPADAR